LKNALQLKDSELDGAAARKEKNSKKTTTKPQSKIHSEMKNASKIPSIPALKYRTTERE
jgi:hypothetical protein